MGYETCRKSIINESLTYFKLRYENWINDTLQI